MFNAAGYCDNKQIQKQFYSKTRLNSIQNTLKVRDKS